MLTAPHLCRGHVDGHAHHTLGRYTCGKTITIVKQDSDTEKGHFGQKEACNDLLGVGHNVPWKGFLSYGARWPFWKSIIKDLIGNGLMLILV